MADWSREENEATVASYFAMLEAGLRGEPCNKAEYRRALAPLLSDRTEPAIEYKYQNISAILIDLKVPYISGYKPAVNYQRDLRTVVVEQLTQRPVLLQLIANEVSRAPELIPPQDPDSVFTAAPKPLARKRSAARLKPTPRLAVDYLLIESRNRDLGLAGEQFVLRLEQERLERAGKSNLASQVSQVSVERGDGLGFDILSFETDAREKLIEVKTTKFGEYTPFYVSRNEVEVSRQSKEHYHLYRVYDYGKLTRIFSKPGALDEAFGLDVASYIAKVS